jgi:hypothetical protein
MSKLSLLVALSAITAITAQNTGVPSYLGQLLIQAGSQASKCLQAANVNGAQVVLADCTGGSSQEWTFTGKGTVTLYGTKCLDVTNGVNSNGNKLQVWDCGTNNPNQQWFYEGYGANQLQWKNKGKCMDLTNGVLTDGNQVQIWTCSGSNPNQVWDVGYLYNQLPVKSESGQTGHNNCGGGSSQSSMCQTLWFNDAQDFCLWGPPSPDTSIGDSEQYEIAWCTKSGHGTRVMPPGTLTGVHFVRTKDYVQVTGVGDLTKININGDGGGGELDPHGADGNGNPIGGLVFGNTFSPNLQYHEWTNFMSNNEFCMRACTGPNARANCEHIYDVMGCYWNMPANYDSGVFESCLADNDLPMGVYGSSTWHQGTNPTPPPHPEAKSSSCTRYATITGGAVARDLSLEKMAKRVAAPVVTPAPIY